MCVHVCGLSAMALCLNYTFILQVICFFTASPSSIAGKL